MNDYFYGLAVQAANIANSYVENGHIDPKWIYCQWVHETDDFTSDLCIDYKNLGGLTQTTPNDTPQPDGSFWYMQFDSYEDYAEYFGKYLHYYEEDGIYDTNTLEEYAAALKNGGYFGDTLENYIAGCTTAYEESFT